MVGGLDWETVGKWAELREEMEFVQASLEKDGSAALWRDASTRAQAKQRVLARKVGLANTCYSFSGILLTNKRHTAYLVLGHPGVPLRSLHAVQDT